MDFRFFLALLTGKLIALILKLTGSGATAAPGLCALKIDPSLVKKFSKKIQQGSIVVSGTNGKTTTTKLIFSLLSTKYNIIHNRQGSNLLRGIASTLIQDASITGKLDSNLALWEVDEATLPQAVINVSPKIVVLLNLFRDQLDRYGEIDSVRKKWQTSLGKTPKSTVFILNADDPQISFIGRSLKHKTIYFGVEEKKLNLPQVAHVADVSSCLNCGSSLSYVAQLSAHMGHYFCKNCNLKRPVPQVSASNLNFKKDFSTKLSLIVNSQPTSPAHSDSESRRAKRGEPLTINSNLPGLFNVYNVLAASSVALVSKIPDVQIKKEVENYLSAFGRFEKVKVNGKKIVTFLIKNPAGANEVIRTLASLNNLNILAILNNKIADGRDVSWIWDTNWEILNGKVKSLFFSGGRAWDLALRFKYANFRLSKKSISTDINYSIQSVIKKLSTNDTLIILPTYTALLEVQKSLAKYKGETAWHNK